MSKNWRIKPIIYIVWEFRALFVTKIGKSLNWFAIDDKWNAVNFILIEFQVYQKKLIDKIESKLNGFAYFFFQKIKKLPTKQHNHKFIYCFQFSFTCSANTNVSICKQNWWNYGYQYIQPYCSMNTK